MSEIDEPVRMTQNGKLVKMSQIDECVQVQVSQIEQPVEQTANRSK